MLWSAVHCTAKISYTERVGLGAANIVILMNSRLVNDLHCGGMGEILLSKNLKYRYLTKEASSSNLIMEESPSAVT